MSEHSRNTYSAAKTVFKVSYGTVCYLSPCNNSLQAERTVSCSYHFTAVALQWYLVLRSGPAPGLGRNTQPDAGKSESLLQGSGHLSQVEQIMRVLPAAEVGRKQKTVIRCIICRCHLQAGDTHAGPNQQCWRPLCAHSRWLTR